MFCGTQMSSTISGQFSWDHLRVPAKRSSCTPGGKRASSELSPRLPEPEIISSSISLCKKAERTSGRRYSGKGKTSRRFLLNPGSLCCLDQGCPPPHVGKYNFHPSIMVGHSRAAVLAGMMGFAVPRTKKCIRRHWEPFGLGTLCEASDLSSKRIVSGGLSNPGQFCLARTFLCSKWLEPPLSEAFIESDPE